MLSAVPSALPPLVSVAVDPEDARAVCKTRKRTPAAKSTPTPTSTGTPTTTATGAPTSKSKKTPAGAKAAAPRTSASGYARTTSSKTTTSASKKPGPLAFLDDPRLSMEEKLLKLLGYLNDKWNKELDKKMKEFKQTSTATSSSSSSGSSSGLGGLAKKAVGLASSAVPQLGVALTALRDPTVRSVLKNVSGPALAAVATAVGQPELAPVALKYGPDLVDAAAGVASFASSGTPASAGSSTRTTTKETADGIGSDKDAQLKLMEMQRILDQQKEMFSMVSNMLRSTHDTRMAVIQNVR